MLVVRETLYQPCKKLKQLQDHVETTGTQKLFASLQKTNCYSFTGQGCFNQESNNLFE